MDINAIIRDLLAIDGWPGALIDWGWAALFVVFAWAVFPWLRLMHAAGNRRLSAMQAPDKPPITF